MTHAIPRAASQLTHVLQDHQLVPGPWLVLHVSGTGESSPNCCQTFVQAVDGDGDGDFYLKTLIAACSGRILELSVGRKSTGSVIAA